MIAFTFPGQGSQKPGMGQPWVDHPSWELVAEASEAAERDVATLLLDADADELQATRNAQLATFVLSMVVLDAVERLGVEPAMLAGHSLGEYTALTASGALELDDGVRLVAERGEAMQVAAEDQEGTMAAVLGLDDDDVEAACAAGRRRRVGRQLQRPRPGRHRRRPRRGRRGRRPSPRSSAPSGSCPSPSAAPSTPRSWRRPATGCARPSPSADLRDADRPSSPTSTPAATPTPPSGQACSPPSSQPGALAPEPAHPRRRPAPPFVELGPGTVLTGMAKRTVRRLLPLGQRPDDLDALLEALAGPAEAEPAGEHLYVPERLVVSPAAGVFRGDRSLHRGDPIEAGDVLGRRERHRDPLRLRRPVRRAARRRRRADDASRAHRLAAAVVIQPVQPTRGIRITGWGTALPDKVVTNADLEARLDTTDEWIRERTGIQRAAHRRHHRRARRRGRPGGPRPGRASTRPTSTCSSWPPPRPTRRCRPPRPPCRTSCGTDGGAFDLNAACSGFVYGLVTGHGMVAIGAHRVLLVGAETSSRITDWDDRSTAILFADGAGAVVLDAVDGPGDLLGWDLGSDGSSRHILYADLGGTMQMDGKEVFRQAVRAMVELGQAGAGAGRRHASTTSPSSSPTRPTSASSTPPASASASPWSERRWCSTAPATPRPASIPLALADALDAGRVHDRRPRAAGRASAPA